MLTGTPTLSGLPLILLLVFIATPLGVVMYMFWLAWTRGGDPRQDAISVQYEPPNNLTPAECGALVDNAVALRSITATITDLSVKGYLAIEQRGSESPGDHTDYIFHLKKPPGDWSHLKAHEQDVLKAIFIPTNPLQMLSEALSQLQTAAGNSPLSAVFSGVQAMTREVFQKSGLPLGAGEGLRTSVPMSELPNQFTLHLERIATAIFEKLVAGGYYGCRPDRVRLVYGSKGIFLGFLMAVVGGALASTTRTAPLALILIGLLNGAIVLGFGWFLPARTTTGAQTLAKVLGFREFLGRVEKDHIERLEKTPELFEKYLPYAMALAVETRWTHAFASITVPRPQWYQGKRPDGFLPMHLTSDLNQMSSQTGTALTLTGARSPQLDLGDSRV